MGWLTDLISLTIYLTETTCRSLASAAHMGDLRIPKVLVMAEPPALRVIAGALAGDEVSATVWCSACIHWVLRLCRICTDRVIEKIAEVSMQKWSSAYKLWAMLRQEIDERTWAECEEENAESKRCRSAGCHSVASWDLFPSASLWFIWCEFGRTWGYFGGINRILLEGLESMDLHA